MYLISILCGVLLIMAVAESLLNRRKLKKVPVRIHVNGTRGKSTTTRLIAGGLREAGFKVIAKTTGTAARLIYEDGTEEQLKRRGSPRIIENLKAVSTAVKRRADVLVVECMAINPEMQWVSEHRIIRSNIGVITNVRRDHLDQMGPDLSSVAGTLSLTIPDRGDMVTSEHGFLEKFEEVAKENRSALHKVTGTDVTEEEIRRFSYPTYRENVACALKVCTLLGVDRETALNGMVKAIPDPGVMKIYRLSCKQKYIYLVNAFAANDYDSTLMAWETYKTGKQWERLGRLPVFGIYNNRGDRMFRVKDFTEIFKIKHIGSIFLVGQAPGLVKFHLMRNGVDMCKIKTLPGNYSPSDIVEGVIKHVNKCSALDYKNEVTEEVVLFGFGNIKGAGERLVDYFRENGVEIKYTK